MLAVSSFDTSFDTNPVWLSVDRGRFLDIRNVLPSPEPPTPTGVSDSRHEYMITTRGVGNIAMGFWDGAGKRSQNLRNELRVAVADLPAYAWRSPTGFGLLSRACARHPKNSSAPRLNDAARLRDADGQ